MMRALRPVPRSLALLVAVLLVVSAFGLLPAPPPTMAQGSDLVPTEWGWVRGVQAGQTHAFLGIPFAAPPTGNLRWRPPVDPQPWSGERAASTFGPTCPQWDDDTQAVIGSEDCLSVNVWTPIAATPGSALPVLVFLHGGGNVQGSASKLRGGISLYDGQELAARGEVVVVTLQYRLGALGFLVHPGLNAENDQGVSGNYGLLDQAQGLTWVQRNIGNFGGDPARVLLFGESGGAEDTCMLLTSPLARGLFARALIESGGCVAKTAAERQAEGVAFAEAAACGSQPDPIACLRQQPAAALVTAIDTTPISNGRVTQVFGPTVDGFVLPQPPANALALGEYNRVPLIIGSNADEMLVATPTLTTTRYTQLVHTLFDDLRPGAGDEALALYPVGATPGAYPTAREAYAALLSDGQFTCPARRIARLAARTPDTPVYRYFFSRVPDSPIYASQGAFHGLELWYVFQRATDLQYYQARAEDLALQQAILGYWTRLATSGDPNGSGAVAWPAYPPAADAYLELGDAVVAGADVRQAECDFWDSVVPPAPALRLTSSATAVRPGDTITYTLTLVNSGGNAAAVAINATLDGHTSLAWASDNGQHHDGVVTWAPSALSSTHQITRSLAVTVGDAPAGATLMATVAVTATETISASASAAVQVVGPRASVYLPLMIR